LETFRNDNDCSSFTTVKLTVLFPCFSALGFQQFLSQDSDVTLEIVDEGKEHIKREKRRRQRLVESQSRRREFATRFGDVEERGNDF
jgi:hypothetical protein